MLIDRKTLLSTVESVKAALGGKSTIIGLDHFFFDGSLVHAYDGVLTIDAPFKFDFKGGIHGEIFYKFLASCLTETINLETNKSNLIITSGNSRLTLPVLEPDMASREMPKLTGLEAGKVSDKFINALRNNLISINKDASISGRMGVCIYQDDKGLNLFSTDDKTIAWEILDAKIELDDKIIVPANFCQQLLKLNDPDDPLYIRSGFISSRNDAGVRLFSRLLDNEGAPNYSGVVERLAKDNKDHRTIPEGFRRSLEQAELVKSGVEPIKLMITDNTMHISIETSLGAVKDQVSIAGDHKDITIVLDPSLILRCLDKYNQFVATDRAFILRNGENSHHFIATLNQ